MGSPLTHQTVLLACEALSADFQPLTDFRGSGRYRLKVAQNLLHRLALQLTEQPHALEVQNYSLEEQPHVN